MDGGGGPLHQFIESLCGSRHANDHRHRRQIIFLTALDKLLHNGSGLTGFLVLHATVGLIDDDIKMVCLVLYRIR